MTPEQRFWHWFSKHEAKLFDFERDQEKIFNRVSTEMQKVHPDLTFELSYFTVYMPAHWKMPEQNNHSAAIHSAALGLSCSRSSMASSNSSRLASFSICGPSSRPRSAACARPGPPDQGRRSGR